MSTAVRQGSTRPYLRRIRLALLCFSVGANAFVPLHRLKRIVTDLLRPLEYVPEAFSAFQSYHQHWGMMGQYPFAAIVGKILDYYGAWACSLISACLFMTGFGLFANEISNTPDTITEPSTSTFHNLVIYFFISALGTVFSYFSSVFAASKNFPNYIGMAAGTGIALFGLSPTFLSLLASRYFSSPDGEIDVANFLRFLAILCGCVHFIGGFTMHIIPPASNDESEPTPSDPEVPNERTTLLPNKIQDPKTAYSLLLSDRNFWVLAFTMFVVLGSCEMIISNIGTIILSLPDRSSIIHTFSANHSTAIMTATQVRALSVANTLSRLLIGPLADIVSPVPSCTIDGNRGFLRQHRISRIAFLTFSTAVLVCTYSWMVVGVKEQAGIWALSIGTGLAYGCAFTILPSLVSSIWGLSNLGRNYGIITYAPFLGTPAFSYLYAFVSAAHVPDTDADTHSNGVCLGPTCWSLTFQVSAFCAALAFGSSVYLWRAWKGRV
ncbi:MFS general substrate transporter [Chiua virens]|nr:MFS general substrate transporter [Chiua virens]